jgi:predicted MFS family arabinose efflux permease
MGQDARPAITGITLFAGFASTVGWPLSSYLEGLYDWRVVCMFWALCTCCSAFRSMPCYRVPSPTRGKWLKNKSRLELSLRAETTQASVLSALPI